MGNAVATIVPSSEARKIESAMATKMSCTSRCENAIFGSFTAGAVIGVAAVSAAFSGSSVVERSFEARVVLPSSSWTGVADAAVPSEEPLSTVFIPLLVSPRASEPSLLELMSGAFRSRCSSKVSKVRFFGAQISRIDPRIIPATNIDRI